MYLVPAPLHLPYKHPGHPAFSDLPPEALAELDAISAPAEYPSGTTLMRQGDPPNFVRILCHGRAKISTSSREGKTLLLNIANEGNVLGLASAIGHRRYETTAEAYGPCSVNQIQEKDFLLYLSRHSMVCWHALHDDGRGK